MSDVTLLLEKAGENKDPKAQEALFEAVYQELHIIAQSKMAKEKPGHTVQPTILVSDAWLRLFPDGKPAKFENRSHFYGTAAKVMRNVLVDHARQRLAVKRGGNLHKTALSETLIDKLAQPAKDDVIDAVDTALKRFAEVDANTVRLLELRFFVGLSMQEAAEQLGVSLRSAERDYAYFKAWFQREFGKEICN
jgi:RNA polymerase sigma factor (TIGR02999 family)